MFGQNYIRPLVDYRWGDNFYVLLSPSGFVDKSWFGFQSTAWNWRLHSFYVFLHVNISNMSFLYINMHVVAEYLLFHEVHVVFKYDKQRRLM